MRVMHMDSGLGNQMLDYAEYLAARIINPDGEMYIDTVLYDLPDDKPGMFSKWNGYELESVFGIKAPLLCDKLGKEAWDRIVGKVKESRFWESGWNYAPIITDAINAEGYQLVNMQKNSLANIQKEQEGKKKIGRRMIRAFFQTGTGYQVKQILKRQMEERIVSAESAKYDVFRKYPEDIFSGHSLQLRYKNTGIERIDSNIRKEFTFPQITDQENAGAIQKIRSCNAVSIHARRGDMLSVNAYCYKYGYFKRAVQYIKHHVENPVFFFFCDQDSRGWCEQNEDVFGLNFQTDHIEFVTWNAGKTSFRDMQLMAECRHNIFTESSFGFWGAYLNSHPDKITCAPDPTINATNWF